jgi:hypothetical protein
MPSDDELTAMRAAAQALLDRSQWALAGTEWASVCGDAAFHAFHAIDRAISEGRLMMGDAFGVTNWIDPHGTINHRWGYTELTINWLGMSQMAQMEILAHEAIHYGYHIHDDTPQGGPMGPQEQWVTRAAAICAGRLNP